MRSQIIFNSFDMKNSLRMSLYQPRVPNQRIYASSCSGSATEHLRLLGKPLSTSRCTDEIFNVKWPLKHPWVYLECRYRKLQKWEYQCLNIQRWCWHPQISLALVWRLLLCYRFLKFRVYDEICAQNGKQNFDQKKTSLENPFWPLK